jgi:NitT/TauT family transport system ATP-binding protein
MSTQIDLRGVSQVFQVRGEKDRRQRDFVALNDVDLTVRSGEFLTLVGPSGCGKSTILDLISGLTRPTAGTVTANGREITGPGPDRSVVFQQYTLLPWRTARQNIEFALEAVGGLRKADRVARADECLALVGLSDFAHRYPHELSGGMKQRIAIARSLSYEPGVLLMDEPFGALDAQTRERLQEELLRIWRRTETTVVFITHDIEEAVFLGQRVAVMSAKPGAIRKVIDIPLGGDADEDVRATAEFGVYRHEVWRVLRETEEQEAAPARAVSFVA